MDNGNTTDSLILSERWRLAVLDRAQVLQLGFMAVIIGMIFALFHLLGNTVGGMNSQSAFVWMVARWSDSISYGGVDWSFGWVVPPFCLVVVWLRRRELLSVPKAINQWGLAVIVSALLIHWLGAKMQQTRLSLASLILLLWGLPLYFFGWQMAKILIFPCTYLIFCIPLTFLDTLSFPLRMFVTHAATAVLNIVGIEAHRSGTSIYSAAGGGFSFDVADPCSGLRSLLAMTALTAAYAYFTQKTMLKQWILFLACIPLAIAGNVARVITVALVAEALGDKVALGLYHDYSTYIVFSVAVGFMIGIGILLNTNLGQVWRRVKAWSTQRM
ncbi:MAG: exosortase/archaeosortase family protein [Kiritimatiellaeota bacterium]|nr:exosortase/archaeosortase family protein [Kiritimatiellota bacterium]